MTTDPYYVAAAADAHRAAGYAAALPLQPHPAVAGALPTYNHVLVSAYRDASTAPLRKLSVDLIKTYKFINEVHLTWHTCSGASDLRSAGRGLDFRRRHR